MVIDTDRWSVVLVSMFGDDVTYTYILLRHLSKSSITKKNNAVIQESTSSNDHKLKSFMNVEICCRGSDNYVRCYHQTYT